MNRKWYQQLPIEDIHDITPVSGGDVNKAYRIDTTTKPLFLLVQPNETEAFYTSEIAGLKELEKAGIQVPHVYGSGEIDNHAYLILEFLEEGSGSQKELGELVAKMHRYENSNNQFGFDYPYQGSSVSFDNTWTDTWSDLFVERRLDFLRNRLLEANLWDTQKNEEYETARAIIIEALSEHNSAPSLLHGDLWSGNFMFLTDGSPVLFDPNVLYGDREFDIGITTVFGGFNQDFYRAYQESYPLDEGATQRLEFYRLYFLMVHLHKFGYTYAGSVNDSLEAIIHYEEEN